MSLGQGFVIRNHVPGNGVANSAVKPSAVASERNARTQAAFGSDSVEQPHQTVPNGATIRSTSSSFKPLSRSVEKESTTTRFTRLSV